MLPLIPFAHLPRKEWHRKLEKKPRMIWQEELKVRQDDLEEQSNGSEASDESSEYDLLQHIASLMPDVKEGKVAKKADDTHLRDMRVKPEKKQYIKKALARGMAYIKGMRARERERRKHYLIKDLERKVREYNALHQKAIQDELLAEEEAVRREQLRRQQRIARNSRKKREKTELAENFSRNLTLRNRQAAQMQFFCERLPAWAIDGQRRSEELAAGMAEEALKSLQRAEDAKKKKEALEHLQRDAALLAAEEAESAAIETLMLKYGTISVKPKKSEEDAISSIFSNARQAKLEQLSSSQGFVDDDEDSLANTENSHMRRLDLHLKDDIDLLPTEKALRKDKFKRDKRGTFVNPFETDFTATADVVTLRGHDIEEVGAMSFAVELSRGACAMLQELDLRHCCVRDNGFARVLQGMKMSNLTTIRLLDLRGNLLTAKSINYMKEIASSGIFQSLDSLLLAQNELGDEGADALIRMLFGCMIPLLRVVSLSWNSITDVGFRALVSSLSAIQASLLPCLQQLMLNNNLVTPQLRRELSPLPAFICV